MPTMEPTLTLEMRACVSPSLVAYAGMLELSSPDLEEVVERELSENPALERAEAPHCPLCESGDRESCGGGGPPGPQLSLDARRRPDPAHAMARVIADRYLKLLGSGRRGAVAAALGCDEAQVAAAHDLIRARCSPFPAPGLHEPRPVARQPAVPDVAISAGEDGTSALHVELVERGRFAMQVEPNYGRLAALIQDNPASEPAIGDRELQAHVADFVRQAATFIARLDERFRTIRRVVEYAADRQRDFVLGGPRYLRPLAQADAARDLGMHESTVSRAVAGKYMMMPSHAVVPIQDFFRAALAPQEALRQLIAAEERPLSDAELAQRLSAQGFPLARRTVAKYRDLLGLAAAPLRPMRGAAKRGSR